MPKLRPGTTPLDVGKLRPRQIRSWSPYQKRRRPRTRTAQRTQPLQGLPLRQLQRKLSGPRAARSSCLHPRPPPAVSWLLRRESSEPIRGRCARLRLSMLQPPPSSVTSPGRRVGSRPRQIRHLPRPRRSALRRRLSKTLKRALPRTTTPTPVRFRQQRNMQLPRHLPSCPCRDSPPRRSRRCRMWLSTFRSLARQQISRTP